MQPNHSNTLTFDSLEDIDVDLIDDDLLNGKMKQEEATFTAPNKPLIETMDVLYKLHSGLYILLFCYESSMNGNVLKRIYKNDIKSRSQEISMNENVVPLKKPVVPPKPLLDIKDSMESLDSIEEPEWKIMPVNNGIDLLLQAHKMVKQEKNPPNSVIQSPTRPRKRKAVHSPKSESKKRKIVKELKRLKLKYVKDEKMVKKFEPVRDLEQVKNASKASPARKPPKKIVQKKSASIHTTTVFQRCLDRVLDYFGMATFQRGNTYKNLGNVFNMNIQRVNNDPQGLKISTLCFGNQVDPYMQEILLKSDKIQYAKCTCHVKKNCKHSCAAMLAYLDFKERGYPLKKMESAAQRLHAALIELHELKKKNKILEEENQRLKELLREKENRINIQQIPVQNTSNNRKYDFLRLKKVNVPGIGIFEYEDSDD